MSSLGCSARMNSKQVLQSLDSGRERFLTKVGFGDPPWVQHLRDAMPARFAQVTQIKEHRPLGKSLPMKTVEEQ